MPRRSRSRSKGRQARSPAPVHRPAPVHSPAPVHRPAPVHSPAPAHNPLGQYALWALLTIQFDDLVIFMCLYMYSAACHAPPVSVQVKSGGATIAQGLAFGTGLAVASRAVDGVVGPRPIQHETVVIESAAAAPDACDSHSKAFQDCLNSSGGDVSKCQFYIEALNKCRRNSCS